jgi:chromosome segregation ATPase
MQPHTQQAASPAVTASPRPNNNNTPGELADAKARLARARRDNDRLLHEVRAYREALAKKETQLQALQASAGDRERLQARLGAAEKELAAAVLEKREAQVALQDAARREQALRASLEQLPKIRCVCARVGTR